MLRRDERAIIASTGKQLEPEKMAAGDRSRGPNGRPPEVAEKKGRNRKDDSADEQGFSSRRARVDPVAVTWRNEEVRHAEARCKG